MKNNSTTNTSQEISKQLKPSLLKTIHLQEAKRSIKKVFQRKPLNGVKPTSKIQIPNLIHQNKCINNTSRSIVFQSNRILKYVKSHAQISFQSLILSQSHPDLSLRSVNDLKQSRLSIQSKQNKNQKVQQKKPFQRRTQKNIFLQGRNSSKPGYRDLNNSEIIFSNKSQQVYQKKATSTFYNFMSKNDEANLSKNCVADQQICKMCSQQNQQIQQLNNKLSSRDKIITEKDYLINDLKVKIKQLEGKINLIERQKNKLNEENQKKVTTLNIEVQNLQVQTLNLQENYQDVISKMKYLQIQNETLKMLKIQIQKQKKKCQILCIQKQNIKNKFILFKKLYSKGYYNEALQDFSQKQDKLIENRRQQTSRQNVQSEDRIFGKKNKIHQYDSEWNQSQLSELTSLSQESIFEVYGVKK